MHNLFKVSGYYNIQLIIDKNEKPKLFEINPRISTTACLCLAAGVDFVNLYMVKQKNGEILAKYRTNLRLKRTWLNEIF